MHLSLFQFGAICGLRFIERLEITKLPILFFIYLYFKVNIYIFGEFLKSLGRTKDRNLPMDRLLEKNQKIRVAVPSTLETQTVALCKLCSLTQRQIKHRQNPKEQNTSHGPG